MVKVVLIDTGLMDNYSDPRITGGCSVVSSSAGFEIKEGYSDQIGHGTATADIILKYSENVEIYVIRIYENSLFIKEEKLIFAIRYARENLQFDIMQISSGILTYSKDLHDAVKEIVKEDKKLLISAFDNEGGMSYPAAMPEVLGIDVDKNFHKKEEYEINEDGIVDIRGSNAFFRVPWVNGKKNIVSGTSFLTSYFTAWIGENCVGNINKEYVIKKLEENAKRIHHPFESEVNLSPNDFVKNIKKAITFPFNKEMYCLAAFEKVLPFEITGYYDIKHKFLVGKKVCEVLKYTNNQAVIGNIENVDWDGDFDTVIVGHLSEISSVTKKNYLFEIIEKCKSYHKRVYFFDDLSRLSEKYRNSEEVFSPIISQNQYMFNHFGKLRSCNIPVLAILGTSSRQGKFTLQLKLMNELKKRGIVVDGISTEPTGALFGFSNMFPYGYGSNNHLSPSEIVKTLNEMIFNLESEGNDLIITGGQSGTIPYDLRNEALISFDQHPFLLGINPDGAILCINEKDSISYVKKTINYIESVTSARVFAIVVSSVRNDKNEASHSETITELKNIYKGSKSFHDLLNLDIGALTDNVLEYYGQ